MKDLSSLRYFLDIEVVYSPRGYLLSQLKYVADILERARLTDNNIVNTLVIPDIAATLKIIMKKNRFLASCSLMGEWSCLRSRHLLSWSLGTITNQQKFYGSGLVT